MLSIVSHDNKREEERIPNKRKNIDNIQKNTSKNSQINETPKSSQLSSNSINSLDDKSSDLSDSTDSGKEEKTNNNQKFADKKKTKLPFVKKYFIKNGNDCETCKVDVPLSSRSDANLRSHLAKNHYMEEVLFPPQKKSLKLNQFIRIAFLFDFTTMKYFDLQN